MYSNLAAEIMRKGIKRKELAKEMNLHDRTFYNKLMGRTPFTITEINFILGKFNLPFEYLFESEKTA